MKQPTVFSQAIKRLLPNLDEKLRGEIKEKVLAHLLTRYEQLKSEKQDNQAIAVALNSELTLIMNKIYQASQGI